MGHHLLIKHMMCLVEKDQDMTFCDRTTWTFFRSSPGADEQPRASGTKHVEHLGATSDPAAAD